MSPTSATGGSAGGWETGTAVGRYVLLAPLATGGMAEIWLARQSAMKGFEKLVVIKRMSNALETEHEFVEMFLTEARLAAQLNHPNVVQIYDLGEQSGNFYIAMEYLDGENLAVVRRTGIQHRLPLMDHLCVYLIARAAEGLHYAHTRVGLDGRPLHIVHRDVSPQNLIVTWDGALKLVDFGIARAATQHTNSGKLKGKLAYMSPEQARGEPVDARSDVFALGIVLFELITRTRFLPKLSDLELLTTLAGQQDLPTPASRRGDLPPGLGEIVERALARRKEDRFQSAREMQDALEAWLRTCGATASNHEVADYMQAVFATRIRERRALIESASKAELTPHSAQNIRLLATKVTPGSSTGSQAAVAAPPPAPAKKPPQLALVGAGLVALLALVGGLALVLFPGQPAPVAAPGPAVVAQPVPVVVAPTPPVLVIDTRPAGAILLVNGTNRGTAPQTLEDLGLGEHEVAARLEGHAESARTVKLTQPGERVVIELALTPSPQPVAAAVEPEPTKPGRPVAPKAPAAAKGKLTLKTVPWTTVWLGKRKLGDTPLLNVAVPAGKHVLKLVNPEKQLESTIEVEIEANQTTVKKLVL